jgi:hypothetical protein
VTEPGVWLAYANPGENAGLTVVEVDADGEILPLSVDEHIQAFPTRSGLADFLASGEPHSLSGRVTGFDPRQLEPAEHLEGDAATGTVLREDFEQPAYAVFDYWLYKVIIPFALTLPSGTGVTIAHADVVCGVIPMPAFRFLGAGDEVRLFRDERALAENLAAGLPAEVAEDPFWLKDIAVPAPHYHPLTHIDLTLLPTLSAPAGDTWANALGTLQNLTTTLTGSMKPFISRPLSRVDDETRPEALKPRLRAKVAEALRVLVDDVDRRVTWLGDDVSL